MQDRELYRRILGIESPWKVERVELHRAGESPTSVLHDLKASPGLSSPRSFLTLVDKLEHIRATEALGGDLGWLNNNLRRSLARRARRTDAHRLRELAPPHRYAVLLCFLRDTYVESVDQAVEMHGKIITQTFRRARNELDERIVARRRLIRPSFESRIAVAGRAWGGDPRRGLADGRHRLRPECVPAAWRARTPRRPPPFASSSGRPEWSCRWPRSSYGIPRQLPPELLHDR